MKPTTPRSRTGAASSGVAGGGGGEGLRRVSPGKPAVDPVSGVGRIVDHHLPRPSEQLNECMVTVSGIYIGVGRPFSLHAVKSRLVAPFSNTL